MYTEKDIIPSISYPSGVQEVVVGDHRIVVFKHIEDNRYRAISKEPAMAHNHKQADGDTADEAVLMLANTYLAP